MALKRTNSQRLGAFWGNNNNICVDILIDQNAIE